MNVLPLLVLATAQQLPYLPPDPKAKQPKPVPPPPGAVVLFSGKGEEVAKNWRMFGTEKDGEWKVVKGAMVSQKGNIVSKQEFTDFLLHVEFKVPYVPNEKGQGRGNSGVGLQGWYEIQVLDSSGLKLPGTGDCGAVYSQAAPLVNACKPPLSWQTYDIIFRAPRFVDGKLTEKARVTVFQNGILVQNNTEIQGATGIRGDRPIDKPGPIYLQDHHNPTEFRQIWVVPLPTEGSKSYEPK